jgi:hypothetical protein
MYVPSTRPADTDHRDLLTALKLLSGQDCRRDAAQAQVLLVGLTESRQPDVAQDARAVMRAGLARGWFEDTPPKFFELERLAEASLAHYRRTPQQGPLLVALGLGLFALLGGVVFFVRSSGISLEPATLWGAVAVLLLVVVGVFFLVRPTS